MDAALPSLAASVAHRKGPDWRGFTTERKRGMTQQTNIKAPWSLRFYRDGTEDLAVICDADGDDLASSREFWLPEDDDPMPPTLAAMQVMVTAPKLLQALDYLLTQTVDMDLKYGITLSESEEDARAKALSAIAEATGRSA
jgi:hypothetical protein